MSTLPAAFRTIVLVPLFFILTLITAIYVTIVGHIRRDSPHNDRVIRAWSSVFLSIPPIRYEVDGTEVVNETQMYVVVSNHLSNFDIPLLFRTVPLTIRFLAKKEIYKIPFVAQAMDTVGIVKIDRKAGMSTHQAINAGVANAKERGFSLMVFPEGTRSVDGEMKDFKKGAFRIAIDNHLPILPVVIDGTREANPPHQWLIRRARARVRILAPIDTTGMTIREDVSGLLKDTREQMLEVYDEMRRSHPGSQS